MSDMSAKERHTDELSKIISECYELLNAAFTHTENAASGILSTVEKHLDYHEIREAEVDEAHLQEKLAKIKAIDDELKNDLNDALSALAFQDLVGQRIQKVLTRLQQIEKSLDVKKLLVEVSEEKLKGPSQVASQQNVDDILAQFDL